MEAATKNIQVRTEIIKAQKDELSRQVLLCLKLPPVDVEQVQRALETFHVDDKGSTTDKRQKFTEEKEGGGKKDCSVVPEVDQAQEAEALLKHVAALTETYTNISARVAKGEKFDTTVLCLAGTLRFRLFIA